MTTPGGRRLGDAYVAVVLNAEGQGAKLSKELENDLERVARSYGDALDDSLGDAAKSAASTLGTTLDQETSRSAERAGGRFGDVLKASLARAVSALPDVELSTEVDADTNEARVQLMLLREQLEYLRDAEIGVDLDAVQALAQLDIVSARLTALAASSPDVDVRVNSRAAQAEIARLSGDLRRLSSNKVDIDVDTSRATAALQGAARVTIASITSLTGISAVALSALGPIIIGIGLLLGSLAPIAVAGLGAIAATAVVAGAALGVLAMAFGGVADAYKLMQRQSLEESLGGGGGGGGASNARAIESAQRSLANTRQNAADQAVDAAQRVMRAEEELKETSLDTARAIERAQRRAAEGIASALSSQEEADRSLTRALRDEQEALESLDRTRQEALRTIEDLDLKVRSNALNQRQAVLDLADAEEELFWTQVNRRSTGEQLERGDIAYERQKLRVEELRAEAEELTKAQTESAKKGVDGADEVVSAQRRLEDAQESVADAQRDAADAAREVAEARAEGAREVAEAHEDAERRVRDATRAVDDALRAQERQARQSAFAIEQAMDAVATASEAGGAAGYKAMNRINEEISRLDPATRAFAEYLYNDFRPKFEELQGVAAAGVLPGAQAGLEALANGPFWGQITSLVGTIAEELGGMLERAGERLNSPFWLDFFQSLEDNAVPILRDIETIAWNLAEGFAGILGAFLDIDEEGGSVAQDFTGSLAEMSESFATWGRELKDNPDFKEFIDDIKENLPELIESAQNLGTAIGEMFVWFTENGDDILSVFADITEFFTWELPDWLDPEWYSAQGEQLNEALVGVGEAINEGIREGFGNIGEWFLEQWDTIVRNVKEFFGIKSPSSVFAGFGENIVEGLVQGFENTVEKVITFFSGLPGKAGSALSSLGSTIAGKFSDAFSQARTAAGEKWESLKTWLSELPGKAASAIGNLGSTLYQKGKDLIGGLLDGIGNIGSGASGVARSVANAVIGFINRNMIDKLNRFLEFEIGGSYGLPSYTVNPPDIPQIPTYARGAVIDRPTLGIVGEAGREVIIPLSPGMGARRRELMEEAGLGGGSVSIQQTYVVRDTQSAEEVGAIMGQRVVRDVRNGVATAYAQETA